MADNAEQKMSYVQLRLSASQREDLAKRAGAADMTVPGYIMSLVAPGAAPPKLVDGPGTDDPMIFGIGDPAFTHMLAVALGLLTGKLMDDGMLDMFYSPVEARAKAIGMLIEGIGAAIGDLGAELSDSEKETAALTARQFATTFKRISALPNEYSRRPDLQLLAELKAALTGTADKKEGS